MSCDFWNVYVISVRTIRSSLSISLPPLFCCLNKRLCFVTPNVVCSDLGGAIDCIQRQMMEPGIVCIDIRREFVLEDALREARKKKFSPKKKLKVKVTLLTKKLIFSLYIILLSLGYFCW